MLRVISIAFFFLNFLSFGYSQKADFQFYTTNDGLSSNRIWYIAQDHQGLMWINTGSLNRFDGYNFLNGNNTNNPIFKKKLSGATIHTFGHLLVYIHKNKLVELNTLNGKERVIQLDSFLKPSQYSHQASFFKTINGDGVIPIFDDNSDHISLIKYQNGQCTFLSEISDIYIDPEFNKLTLCGDKNGNFYYLHKDLESLIKISNNGRKIAEIKLPIPKIGIILTHGINESILIFGKQQLFVLEENADSFTSHPINDHFNTIKMVVDVFQSPEGDIWFTGRDRTLFYYEYNSGTLFDFQEQLKMVIPNRLDLGNIFIDNAGIFWIRTITGLLKVSPQRSWFSTYFTEGFDEECGGQCSFRGFAEDFAGNIYASYYSNIFKIDKNGKADETPILQYAHTPFDLFITNEKLLLNDGFVFDLNSNQINNIYQSENDKHHDLGIYVNGAQETIWWAYRNSLYSLNQNEPNPVWKKELELEEKSAIIITDLAYDNKQNKLWLGSNNGLYKFDLKTKKNEHLNDVLFNDIPTVRNIHIDENEILWLGTEKGLFKLDQKNQTLKKYSVEDGLPNNYIVTILPEGDFCLWLGTNKGLSRFSISSQSFINFYLEDGLAQNEFNRRSAFKASDGRMYFGGVDGVTAFYPEQVMGKYRAPIQSEKLSLTAFSKTDVALDSTITSYFSGNAPTFDIYHENKTFQFEFALTDYRNSEKAQYSYQVEGYDDVWSKPSSSNIIKFNTLSSGHYTLNVKALNSKGQRHPNEFKIGLIVHPPWWASWWAYSLYILVAAGITFVIFSFLKKRLELRNELLLEQQEAHRLKELDGFKSRLYTNLTHEFRTPLTVILGMSRQILASPKNGVEKAAKLIENNGNNLLRLVNQLLDLSKLEDKSFKLNLQHSDIISYLRYLTESFQTYANSQNLSLRFFTTTKKLEMDFDPEQLKQVMNNFISNAVKFTPSGGDISVSADSENSMLQIKVKDNGIGISPKDLPHIFDRFYQVDGSTTRAGEGTGIGLAHSRELVKLMKGKISVESQLGKGTVFQINLPILKSAISTVQPLEHPKISEYVSTQAIASPTTENETNSARPENGLAKLLIIEDNPDVVTYLKSCLTEYYQLDIAYNGKIGIEKAIEEIPELIISDVMMPEKDGYEVCDILKNDERTSHIPIILLTAKADAASKIAGLRRGADAYLSKPFDKEELLVRLEMLLEKHRRLVAYFSNHVISKSPMLIEIEPELQESAIVENVFLKKVDDIIENNFEEEDFGLPQLCQKVGMSRSQLFRKMKALINVSPSDYIRRFRLAKAKSLLEDTGLTIAEVAYQTGFKDPSYFSKIFQEEYGQAPSLSRK